MAAANPTTTLQDETTCSICLESFQDPVIILCGHSFCRACITKYWKESINTCCPVCRTYSPKKNLIPNRHLDNIVKNYKELRLPSNSPQRKRICNEHKKALSLFCENDANLLCTVCERSKAHQGHLVVCTEKAAKDYKVTLQKCLENLKEERNHTLSAKSDGGKSSQELLNETQAKRQEVVSGFQQQLQFLKEQEEHQLATLEDLEGEIENRRDNFANRLEDNISYITTLITEIEEKGNQPADEFLENIGSILNRCETMRVWFPAIVVFFHTKEKLKTFSEESTAVQCALRKCREIILNSKWIKENVLLDPETAHPRYIVSPDWKSVTWGDVRQEFPYSPKRFEYARCVLGTEGFTSGKHYWTVDVGDGEYWAVGVARESVERKVEINFNPDEGIWAVGCYCDEYKALTSPPIILEIDDAPMQIQVSLNYGAGTVAFYYAIDKTPLYIFESTDFEGERVFPFFRIVDSSDCLQLCS